MDKAKEYLEKLIEDDFMKCEDSFLGDERATEIIKHCEMLGLTELAEKLNELNK